jgi:uncharacterized protein involved in outer membrane biogenesis
MKKVGIFLIIIIVIVGGAVVAKNIIAKSAVSTAVKLITGLKLEMSSMNVGVVNTLVGIKDLKLFNPPDFKDAVMVDMPEIYVNYDLGALLKKKIHLEEVRIDLKQFTVVKNAQGQLNLDSLKVVQESKEKEKKEKAAMPELTIDLLQLKIGKVVYKDYSRGGEPQVKEFNVNLNERYENITDPYALGSLIVVKALANTTIASLANFDLGPLRQGLTQSLQGVKDVAVETSTKAVEAVGEGVGKATDTIKKILPFGK